MEKWQLKQFQVLPLEIKIRKTQLRIQEWYEHWDGDIFISFSGGKDSTVLLDITRKMYPDVEAVFIDTGLEYPEIREFVKTFDNVTWLKPKMNFKQVIEKYGYPVISKEVSEAVYGANRGWKSRAAKFDRKSRFGTIKYKYLLEAPFKCSHMCCNEMKKKPAKEFGTQSNKKAVIGMLAVESVLRQSAWLRNGCNAFNSKNPTSNPLSFWTEQDILHYIIHNNLEIANCYGKIVKADKNMEGMVHKLTTTGVKRTGCMFCMFGVHLEKEPNRFQMMKQTHPKQYDYCINKLGLGKVLDFIKVDY